MSEIRGNKTDLIITDGLDLMTPEEIYEEVLNPNQTIDIVGPRIIPDKTRPIQQLADGSMYVYCDKTDWMPDLARTTLGSNR